MTNATNQKELEANRIESLKIQMRMGEQCIEESKNWIGNQSGGWEILARGYKRIAEELMEMLDAKQEA